MRNPPSYNEPRKRFKDSYLRACTCNVRSGWCPHKVNGWFNRRRRRSALDGWRQVASYDIYDSVHIRRWAQIRCWICGGARLRRLVLAFPPVDERLVRIHTITKFFNTCHDGRKGRCERSRFLWALQRQQFWKIWLKHGGTVRLSDWQAHGIHNIGR